MYLIDIYISDTFSCVTGTCYGKSVLDSNTKYRNIITCHIGNDKIIISAKLYTTILHMHP